MKATRLSETWETIGRELKMKQNKTKQIWDKIFIKSVTLWKPNVTLKLDANPQWSKLLPLLFLIHWLIMELIINVIENHCWILWRLLPNNILWKNVKKKRILEGNFKQCFKYSESTVMVFDLPQEVHGDYKYNINSRKHCNFPFLINVTRAVIVLIT